MANNDSTKRVPLELLCMLILKEDDRYGYEMVQEIESRSGGLLSFNLASVYVALRRLEERGCVSSRTDMTDAAPACAFTIIWSLRRKRISRSRKRNTAARP